MILGRMATNKVPISREICLFGFDSVVPANQYLKYIHILQYVALIMRGIINFRLSLIYDSAFPHTHPHTGIHSNTLWAVKKYIFSSLLDPTKVSKYYIFAL